MDDSTLNTLFIVNYKDNELLIPAQEELITDINPDKKVITVNLPEGLLTIDQTEEV